MKLSVGGVINGGNSVEKSNEGIRNVKPVIVDKAVNALFFCPDSAIFVDGKGNFKVDTNFCKGCGICAKECPRSVDLVEEVK